ncbi:Cytochrome P450 [Penicillium expansum]|nr:Cytochrome P450 [Penicillium expansum]
MWLTRELHTTYGPAVRIGPNVLDLDIPKSIKTIDNIKSDYLKVNISLTAHIDDMISYLCQRLEEKFIDRSNPTETRDLGEWIADYTWDVVGNATFRQPVGYLEKGCNFDKTLRIANFAMDFAMDYFSLHLMDRFQNKDTHYHDPSKPEFL